jgi:hypothetical protein
MLLLYVAVYRLPELSSVMAYEEAVVLGSISVYGTCVTVGAEVGAAGIACGSWIETKDGVVGIYIYEPDVPCNGAVCVGLLGKLVD